MKTLLIVVVTLIVSQFIYQHQGPHNIISKASNATIHGVQWVLHSALNFTK